MVYIINRPTATEKLSVSQPLIRNNFTSANTSFGIDHYSFDDGTADDGRHKIVHQTNVNDDTTIRSRSGSTGVISNFPSNITDVNQVFSAQYTPPFTGATTDTQLFSVTGNGGISQLTGYSATIDGWQWLGGILLQWGFVTVTTTSTGTVTFLDRGASAQGIPFPNNCFTVTATLTYNGVLDSGDRNTVFIEKNNAPSPSRLQFKWKTIIEDTTIRGFFWHAIGN